MSLAGLSDQELQDLIHAAAVEENARRDLDEIRGLAWKYVNQGGSPHRTLVETAEGVGLEPAALAAGADASLPERDEGKPWVQPTHAGDAYRAGDVVMHKGISWESTHAVNTHAPGVSGWHPLPVGGGAPIWVQPSGAHDAYSEGDIVSHDGKTWVNVHPGERTNTWMPSSFGWDEIEGTD